MRSLQSAAVVSGQMEVKEERVTGKQRRESGNTVRRRGRGRRGAFLHPAAEANFVQRFFLLLFYSTLKMFFKKYI